MRIARQVSRRSRKRRRECVSVRDFTRHRADAVFGRSHISARRAAAGLGCFHNHHRFPNRIEHLVVGHLGGIANGCVCVSTACIVRARCRILIDLGRRPPHEPITGKRRRTRARRRLERARVLRYRRRRRRAAVIPIKRDRMVRVVSPGGRVRTVARAASRDDHRHCGFRQPRARPARKLAVCLRRVVQRDRARFHIVTTRIGDARSQRSATEIVGDRVGFFRVMRRIRAVPRAAGRNSDVFVSAAGKPSAAPTRERVPVLGRLVQRYGLGLNRVISRISRCQRAAIQIAGNGVGVGAITGKIGNVRRNGHRRRDRITAFSRRVPPDERVSVSLRRVRKGV